MRRALLVGSVVLLLASLLLPAVGQVLGPGGTFSDDDGNTHEGNIEAIAAAGVTKGCNPPVNDLYCPSDPVTRGQMAAFLVRAFGLPAATTDPFSDDDGTTFEADINALAEAGITKGCNPPANTLFCPNDYVTRGQMAAFLVRAFGYTDDGGGDLFDDDDGTIFEADIDKLGTAGVTKGCNPPTNNLYCPDDRVLRDQMASFLARALGLDPIIPPPPTTTTTGGSTTTSTDGTTSTTGGSTTTTTMGGEVEVSMDEFFYSPDPVNIAVGDTVRWTNDGSIPHTTTSGTGGPSPAPDGIWDSGAVQSGMTFDRTFTTAGSFTYYCTIHPTLMSSTVVVS